MTSRMFTRRGEWSNQFGTHARMGFWGFFWDQYGITGKLFTFTLFPLGLFGLFELIYRRWKKGIPIFLMVLAATVGLVLYMNFADGTLQGQLGADDAHLEVRDRDYFWQSGFVLFALAIGLGFAAIWDFVANSLRSRNGPRAATYLLLAGLALPAIAIAVNYPRLDRSNDYIPYDYAYNLLTSADSNAIVFTNGDNDTFPVWCLQEVYGIRRDVRIANLSLINTNWYIKQLKNEMGVPISFTDAQIDGLRHGRTPDGKFLRIQDMMIDNIIETNRWQVPINFSVTVSDDNRVYRGQSLDDHLEMYGMMYRLKKEKGDNMIDIEGTKRLYLDDFKYRGVADPKVPKDENTSRLTNNYGAGFLYCADNIRRKGDLEGAIDMTLKAIEVLPSQWQNYGYLIQLLDETNSLERADEILRQAPDDVDLSQAWTSLAHSYWQRQDKVKAYTLLQNKLGEYPDSRSIYNQLLNYYYRDNKFDSLESLLEHWSMSHPEDMDAQQALTEVRQLQQRDSSASGVRVRQVDTVRDNTSSDSAAESP